MVEDIPSQDELTEIGRRILHEECAEQHIRHVCSQEFMLSQKKKGSRKKGPLYVIRPRSEGVW